MLTDAQIRKAKAADKAFKLTDGAGLHLFVTPAGGKHWRYRYEFGGKEKLLSLGPYPALSLLDARKARDEAKSTLRTGKDPSITKKLQRLAGAASAATTFESVSREWHALQKSGWVERHAFDVLDSLEREVFPKLGSVPISEIGAQETIAVLREIESRGANETARRVRQRMSAVFVYAISTGRAEGDPAAVVQKAMAPLIKGRQPAVTDLAAARVMLNKVEAEHAHPVTKLALRILALTAVRPGALAETPWVEWAELTGPQPMWLIPAARMKLKLRQKSDEARDHLVPLSRQAVEAIEALRKVSGRGPLAFPNTRHAHKPMSENAMGYLLHRAGYHGHHVPHGWRSTFSSVMNERFKADKAIIDLMLAHVPENKVEGAYNRALHIDRRRELAQEWADLILEGAKPADELLLGPRR
ncbi:integrase arm-type DNA-binding domain-containing protein [Bosea sp. FBZP-16]|uniref:tyrosine-type recombinase/integrase n=1 Tax=Bosea sp. FBZP-16 TaxID=2065382 RepID=UPI000C30A674|nr:integrase arm-type DNA-binding domain-containing protein [Bosea sp. FBZP-16]